MIAIPQNLKTEKNKFIQPLALTHRITSIDLLRGIALGTEFMFADKTISVTGKVTLFKDKPQIVVSSP